MEKRLPPRRLTQKRNWLLSLAIVSFIALTFYGITTNVPLQILRAMASANEPTTSTQDIPIKVSLSPVSSPVTSEVTLNFKVTLENTSPSEKVHILRWNSPVDASAVALGAFTFTSAKTGEESPTIGLMIRRKMPDSGYFSPNDEEIVSIEAGGKIEKVVAVRPHDVSLEKGETYRVKAAGSWTGVWVGNYQKLRFNEGMDLKIGEFVSESFEVKIPG